MACPFGLVAAARAFRSPSSGGEGAVRVVIVVQGKTKLFEVVGALHTSCRFARRLDCGKEKTDQNTNDRDNDKKFYERETAPGTRWEFHGYFLYLKALGAEVNILRNIYS